MSKIAEVLGIHQSEILADWIAEQEVLGLGRGIDQREVSAEILTCLRKAAKIGRFDDIQSQEWTELREILSGLSRSRGLQGFTPTETASYIFSLRKPLFQRLQAEWKTDPSALYAELTKVATLLDKLALWTTEVHQKTREEVITRQQQEMLELSTPVVKLWDGILALPMIGTLDSMRTQVVMESLLQRIVETGSQVAIIDITGVPLVDTLVAQHLLKTVTAARLMGADCIISGIRPQIAQTIVHLGVDLAGVTTKATLADALALAMQRSNLKVIKINEKL